MFVQYKSPGRVFVKYKNMVDMKSCTLTRLKSHDCHIIIQHLLPVAIRSVMPRKVREVITRLCLFFKSVFSKFIDRLKLTLLRYDIVEVLCKMEKSPPPPGFFDIMIHLTDLSNQVHSQMDHNIKE